MNTEVLMKLPRRILVIDDNPLIHEDIRKIIGSANRRDELAEAATLLFGDEPQKETGEDFKVEMDSAHQGQEGVALLKKSLAEERPYMMAFVDMRMPPGWDGIETIQNLWKVSPQLQVVICTAYSDRPWQEINQLLGRSANLIILKKPFEIMEVLQLIETLTHKWILGKRAEARMGALEKSAEDRGYELVKTREELAVEAEARTEVQQAWLEAEERFHTVFESMWVAQAVLRADTLEHVDVNLSYLEFLGQSRTEVVGHTLRELDLAGDPQGMGRVLSEFQAGRAVSNLGIVLGCSPFEKRPALASLTALKIGTQSLLLLTLLDARKVRPTRDSGAVPAAVPVEKKSNGAAPVTGNGPTGILLVEDDPMVRQSISQHLRRLGYQVLDVADGEEALRCWETNREQIGLLYTDMVMPGKLSGLQLAQNLKAEKRALHIIISSGYNIEIPANTFATGEGFLYLPKPTPPDIIADTVHHCFTRM